MARKCLEMTKTAKKRIVRQLIKEYAGSHFFFMENYIEGGFESSVSDNFQKIVYRNSFGKEHKREVFKDLHSNYMIEQRIFEICEDIIEYVNKELQRYKIVAKMLIRN